MQPMLKRLYSDEKKANRKRLMSDAIYIWERSLWCVVALEVAFRFLNGYGLIFN